MVRLTEEQLASILSEQSEDVRKRNEAAVAQLGLFGQAAPVGEHGKAPRTSDDPLEEYEGERLMIRVRMYEERYPELQDFVHMPNGGKRLYSVGAAMKRQGTRRGYPDYLLQHARHGYHSLIIELKRRNGVPSDVRPEQRAFIKRLRAAGNRVDVCFGHEQAIAALEDYLGVNMPLQFGG